MNSLSALGFFRNDISDISLDTISDESYENIFRVYQTENPNNEINFYYYNILNSIYLPSNIPPAYYYTITLKRATPWTVISYNEYKTVNLWWLILLANNIKNPVLFPEAGSVLKIIKTPFVKLILNDIRQQLTT
jgi:hypothetical protein